MKITIDLTPKEFLEILLEMKKNKEKFILDANDLPQNLHQTESLQKCWYQFSNDFGKEQDV